ncbi:uncharacterized protein LOC143149472 [Ptiloglossa arizonensis]|uniref:uncharacterized protein LOC143149472 n=1 Tax=Ptiloglossa arizonensis TaxID=3350558 RepID=UPI003FA15C48
MLIAVRSRQRQLPWWQFVVGEATETTTSSNCYQCNKCGRTYVWKSSFQRHMKQECGEKLQRAVCKNCGRQYRWRDSLNRHLKYECGREPSYVCSACDRKFRHKQLLANHLLRFHETPPRNIL